MAGSLLYAAARRRQHREDRYRRRSLRWLVLLVPLGLISGNWMMAAHSEERSMHLMAARLVLSMSSRGSEQVMRGQQTAPASLNPFQLLAVVPDNYCGELQGRQPPRRGCWYFRPETREVLYRSRFSGWIGPPRVQLWQLVELPIAASGVRHLELRTLGEKTFE